VKDSDDGDTRMIYDQSSDIIMKDEKYVRRDLYMRDFSDLCIWRCLPRAP
jgi:hypothetical protein